MKYLGIDLGGTNVAAAVVDQEGAILGKVSLPTPRGVEAVADQMAAADGSPFTAHTTNPVPFCVVGYPCELKEGGRLCDISPTMLHMLGLPQPAEMTGVSLIK